MMTAEEIGRKSLELRNKIRRGALVMLIGTCFILYLAWLAAYSFDEYVPAGTIAIAAIYTAYEVYSRRPPSGIPTPVTVGVYANQLERRSNNLRSIWRWYGVPMLVALLAFALALHFASPKRPQAWRDIGPFVLLSFIWAVLLVVISVRESRRLQGELDHLLAATREG